ncbi:response regulator [Rhizobium lemnae]|uniref:histidine kinase n=1 Tax=Rhizobium lemnae TaxID=1214924 RepID=A0ABV8EDV3_9HYPH|nr:response regulator [Rhizobium lemnae]MCJ8509395.1 response regulator [Rhizobium lemnae]
MENDSALLEKACRRIGDLTTPAFIKDGSLRYVAVNAAYASLSGIPLHLFKGRRAEDIGGFKETAEFSDKQRRALVFGTDEVVTERESSGRPLYEVQIERFLSDDDSAFLFALYRPLADPDVSILEQGGGLSDLAVLGPSLDLLDAGIAIFDENERLVFFNENMQAHFAALSTSLAVGRRLFDIVSDAFRSADAGTDYGLNLGLMGREAVEARLEILRRPEWHAVEPMPDGRWLRSVNKRLDNGWIVLLRQDVTDIKVQEMRLAREVEEGQIFRAVFEDLPVAVFLRDSRHRILYVNRIYEEMLGGDRQKFIGKTEQEMFPDSADRYREEHERLLQHGGSIEKDEDVVFQDGQVMAAITRLGRISSPSGEPYIVGSVTDVSLARDAQRRAEAMHEQLRAILEALPVGIAILNSAMRLEYVNQTLNEFWRADGDEYRNWTGEQYQDFLRFNFARGIYDNEKIDVDTLIHQRTEMLRRPGPIPQFELSNPNGRRILVDRMHVGDDKILFTCVDITAIRRREQEALEAREALDSHAEMMRDATGAMSQGILIMNGEQIAFCNDAVHRLLDLPEDDLQVGKQWRPLYLRLIERGNIPDADKVVHQLQEWAQGPVGGASARISMCIGGDRFIDLEMKKSGEQQYLAVYTDVTEIRHRERELQRLLARAEAADKAKSEFLANMSHEIRTPMNGVLGMAELLSKSNLDTKQKTFTEIIVKSGKALMTIINDILDFSKIDAGQMSLRKVPFDVIDAVEDVATLLSSSAAEKDIELIVKASGGDIRVLGDAGRFRQIVTNLLGNAIKFTEQGHVLVDVHAERTEDHHVSLHLRIEDTGIGIPDEQLDRIFEKFSQVDGSSTRRHEGTGLGLSITAGLVEIFGGTIRVESKIGQGSIFSAVLPFDAAPGSGVSLTTPTSVQNARILVIDDNPINRQILSEQLASWGFDGVATASGEEGLTVLRAADELGVRVDALILDYQMPEMNGLAVAAAIRKDARLADLPIIFLTSMDTAHAEVGNEGLNVQAHLMKPARGQLLHSTLVDVVRNGRRDREASNASRRLSVWHAGSVSRAAHDGPVPKPEERRKMPGALEILVAEDNEVNQIVFTQILQSMGVRFRMVENGEQAVAAWMQERPCLILMDVSMPLMNGHQATRRIREIERSEGGRTPIIGVTAHALESDRDLCLAAGMDDYLSKPISPEILIAKISDWYSLDAEADGAFQV